MAEGIGYGRRNLIRQIVLQNWKTDEPENKTYNFQEILFIIQEMLQEEGKHYFEARVSKAGFNIFRHFVQHLLYRNLANYDSMILITSEKGCITGDALLEMPRDLKKYPKGIPLKELVDKGPIYVYSFNVKTQKLELKKCDGIEFVKEDDVWEIELTNGMKVKATKDHPFLQVNGTYKQLKDLFWHAHIFKSGYRKGEIVYDRKGAKNTDRLQMVVRFGNSLNNDMFRTHYGIKPKLSIKEKNQKEHNFIYEQLYDKISENCKTNVGSVENIILHSKQRKEWIKDNPIKAEKFHNNAKQIRIEANKLQNGGIIKSVKYIGKKKVYDVVNVQDNHNFIVNGFVVSNTGKSSAAIMMAREWCRLIGRRFDPNRHIAYNNADVMRKIDQLNKFEPIVCDEAIRFASACIVGDTKIKTPQGNIKIKELKGKENFEVYSFNEKTKKEEIQLAEKCIKVKEDIVYELETEDGKKIQATKEHKFLTTTGWKTLEELKEGDDLVDV